MDFSELLLAGRHRFKLMASSQAAKGAPVVDPEKENPPKETHFAPKPGWLPRKMYLANLEADGAAKADAASDIRPNRSRSRRARSRSNRSDPARQRRASPKSEPMRPLVTFRGVRYGRLFNPA